MSKYDELLSSAQEIVLNALTAGRELTDSEKNTSFNLVHEAKELKRISSGPDSLRAFNYLVENTPHTEKKSMDLGTMLLENDQFKAWSKNTGGQGNGYI